MASHGLLVPRVHGEHSETNERKTMDTKMKRIATKDLRLLRAPEVNLMTLGRIDRNDTDACLREGTEFRILDHVEKEWENHPGWGDVFYQVTASVLGRTVTGWVHTYSHWHGKEDQFSRPSKKGETP